MKFKKGVALLLSAIFATGMLATTSATSPTATLAISTTVLAFDTANELGNVSDALQEIGLSFESGVLSQEHSDFSTVGSSTLAPHIGRISPNSPILITSEADVDVLLTFARIVIEQGLDGFGWDTCIDDALAESGLYDYWRAGWRELTRPAREQQIATMAENYTFDELSEMGVFYRQGMLENFQSEGYFQESLAKSHDLEIQAISPRNVHSGTISRRTLHTAQWLSNFRLFNGDTISYTVNHQLAPGVQNLVRFAVGIGRHGQGVRLSIEYLASVYRRTNSRTFHVARVSDLGPEFFGIQPGGGGQFTVDGSYRVTW